MGPHFALVLPTKQAHAPRKTCSHMLAHMPNTELQKIRAQRSPEVFHFLNPVQKPCSIDGKAEALKGEMEAGILSGRWGCKVPKRG